MSTIRIACRAVFKAMDSTRPVASERGPEFSRVEGDAGVAPATVLADAFPRPGLASHFGHLESAGTLPAQKKNAGANRRRVDSADASSPTGGGEAHQAMWRQRLDYRHQLVVMAHKHLLHKALTEGV